MNELLMKQRARELRTKSTDAERHLWYYLRAHRLGYKFKRQVPIERFIVDFICYEKRLVIELDGGQHQDKQKAYDARRTAILNKKGFRILRFWNHEVLQHTEEVLEAVCQALSPTLSRE
jgi:very-short-patch-repair endonuclease